MYLLNKYLVKNVALDPGQCLNCSSYWAPHVRNRHRTAGCTSSSSNNNLGISTWPQKHSRYLFFRNLSLDTTFILHLLVIQTDFSSSFVSLGAGCTSHVRSFTETPKSLESPESQHPLIYMQLKQWFYRTWAKVLYSDLITGLWMSAVSFERPQPRNTFQLFSLFSPTNTNRRPVNLFPTKPDFCCSRVVETFHFSKRQGWKKTL